MEDGKKELLKKLRRKAELCRHIEGEEYRKCERGARWIQMGAILGGLVTASSGSVYFKIEGSGSWVEETCIFNLIPYGLLVIPAIITAALTLEQTALQYGRRSKMHERAIHEWGKWIRRADEYEKTAEHEGGHEDIWAEIMERYGECMGLSQTIPMSSRKFLRHKKNHINRINESMEMDKFRKQTPDVAEAEQ